MEGFSPGGQPRVHATWHLEIAKKEWEHSCCMLGGALLREQASTPDSVLEKREVEAMPACWIGEYVKVVPTVVFM